MLFGVIYFCISVDSQGKVLECGADIKNTIRFGKRGLSAMDFAGLIFKAEHA